MEVMIAMSTPPEPEITKLLAEWHNGNQAALEKLTALVYQELHKVAQSCLRRGMEQ
jgi:predicted kinase